MSGIEVRLRPAARGDAGRFSGIDDAFRRGAEAALRKYALFDGERNAAETLAKLFRSSNFGFDRRAPAEGYQTRDDDFRWARPEPAIERSTMDPLSRTLPI